MFVGHALLAFALVAAGTATAGIPRRRALALGVLAGGFAAAPDVDIAYALVGVATAETTAPLHLATSFWATGSVVHRAVTHSLVVAPGVAVAAALWTRTRRRRLARAVAVAVLAVLVGVATAVSGPLGGAVMALFGAAALWVATLGVRHLDAGPRAVFGTALVGLGSHPFGDLFTGTPPAMLYPLDATLLADRIALSADPTLHLLGAFFVELATVWLAVAVAMWLLSVRPAPALPRLDLGADAHVLPRATVGAGYAATVLLIPAPTLDLSYPFVFSVLAVGSVGFFPTIRIVDRGTPGIAIPDRATGALTGLAAVTVAALAYAAAYVVA